MSYFENKKLLAFLVLLSVVFLTPTVVLAQGQVTSLMVGWNSPYVKTSIDVTNTTSATLDVRFDYNAQNGYGQHLWVQTSGDDAGSATIDFFHVMAGTTRTVTVLGTSVCDSHEINCYQNTADTSFTQFSIRAYVSGADVANQKDGAIVAKISYAPAIATVALPWGFPSTAVKESLLTSSVMGKITETPIGSQPAVTDRHNMFMLLNTTTPQVVRISVLDSNGNVLGVPFVTRKLDRDELYDATRFVDLFGSSMLPAGSTGDTQVRVLFEGLGGGKIFSQTVELDGAPYAISPVSTWSGK